MSITDTDDITESERLLSIVEFQPPAKIKDF